MSGCFLGTAVLGGLFSIPCPERPCGDCGIHDTVFVEGADVRRLIAEGIIVIRSGRIDYLRCYGAEAPKFMPGTVISINQGISPEKN